MWLVVFICVCVCVRLCIWKLLFVCVCLCVLLFVCVCACLWLFGCVRECKCVCELHLCGCIVCDICRSDDRGFSQLNLVLKVWSGCGVGVLSFFSRGWVLPAPSAGLAKLGWLEHDGTSYGRQEIFDADYNISTTMVRSPCPDAFPSPFPKPFSAFFLRDRKMKRDVPASIAL